MLLDLPEIPLPDWAAGVRLLGPVTSEALLAGLYDGLRLAAIIICVGAANSLANPKRAARLRAAGALRDRHRPRRRGDDLPAARGQRPAGPGRPGAARRRHDGRRSAPALPGAGPRGRARAIPVPGSRHGHPRLRPLRRRDRPRALGDRVAAAPRPHRHLRRDVRLARPHGPAGPRAAHARRGRRGRGRRAHQRRTARAAHPLPARPVARRPSCSRSGSASPSRCWASTSATRRSSSPTPA